MTAAGMASTASKAIASQRSTVNGQRQRYRCATIGERQKPPASHSCEPPSTAASTAAIAPMPRPPTTIDLDAGFLERAHRAGVVRAVRASAGEQQGRASFW